MGVVRVELPGDFEITIKAKNLDEAIRKMEEIKRKKEKALGILKKYKHSVKIEEVKEEELYS